MPALSPVPSSSSQRSAARLAMDTRSSASRTSRPASSSPACAAPSIRPRRSPSAINPAIDDTNCTSAEETYGRFASRNTVSCPHVPVPPPSTARNSSEKPPGRRTSRWRRLRSSSLAVTSLKLAAAWPAWASWTHLLKSRSRASISTSRSSSARAFRSRRIPRSGAWSRGQPSSDRCPRRAPPDLTRDRRPARTPAPATRRVPAAQCRRGRVRAPPAR